MFVPIILAMAVAAAAYGLSKKSGGVRTGALGPGTRQPGGPGAQLVWDPYINAYRRAQVNEQYGYYPNVFGPGAQQVYLPRVLQAIQYGQQVSPQMLQAAWLEATQSGDQVTANQLQQFYLAMFAQPQIAGEVAIGQDPGEGATSESGDGDGAEGWGEALAATVTTQHHGTPNVQPQPDPTPTPTDYPSGWDKLCEALKYRGADFRTDNLFGAYEHNRRRLRQLGIDESGLSTEAAQLEALNRDLDDYRNSEHCRKLLASYTGTAVDIDGKVHTVTPSGILGLLKAAGPRGAEGWLRSAEDRTSFPETTRVFTRCNGCF